MRPLLVVVRTEGVELELQMAERLRRRLLREVALEGLVESLDLAAALGVIGRGVLGPDAQPFELGLQQWLALARAA
ncbi:MAG TPA: hypothetical protein VHG53_03715 [Candidatus Limnocylindria bacterium]|nr:hypothetical protein [Candidatus Limnocylindria bacterium]